MPKKWASMPPGMHPCISIYRTTQRQDIQEGAFVLSAHNNMRVSDRQEGPQEFSARNHAFRATLRAWAKSSLLNICTNT
eukprot:1139267-Pelagomonas_calceolata.AAC.1